MAEAESQESHDEQPSASGLTEGSVVAGRYRLDKLLGRGGMGTVWACTHLALGERMAIKMISSEAALSKEVRARFAREARASAKLKTRFAVRVFDCGELADGTPFIVMEHLEGETLSHYLRRVGRVSQAETVKIVSQIGLGLSHAHEAGLVHRDIKPENVFLAHSSDDGGVIAKVFDFGVVKLSTGSPTSLEDETVQGTFLGTPQFMSPEQAMTMPDVNHRTDIYSLGVLVHRLLTGHRLFNADSIPGVMIQICTSPLPKLRDELPELPPALDAWFQRTCARAKEHRYATVKECVDALAAAANMDAAIAADISEITGARRVRKHEQDAPTQAGPLSESPPNRRRWFVAALSAAIVLAAIVVVTILQSPGETAKAAGNPAPSVSASTSLGSTSPSTVANVSVSAPVPVASHATAAPAASPTVSSTSPLPSPTSIAGTKTVGSHPSKKSGGPKSATSSSTTSPGAPSDEKITDVGF